MLLIEKQLRRDEFIGLAGDFGSAAEDCGSWKRKSELGGWRNWSLETQSG
jgi:hypothetical protein